MTLDGKNGLVLGLFWIVTSMVPGLVKASEPSSGPPSDALIWELENSEFLRPFGISLAETLLVTGDLDEVIGRAIVRNPSLRSSFSEYQTINESIAQSTGLPDPKLGYTEYLQPVETRVGPQRRSFSLSQTFPWFGSLSAKGDVTRENAAAARSHFFSATLDIISEVKIAYYDLGYLEQALRITRNHIAIMTQLEDVSRARYSAGSGRYADILKAQVELGLLRDRLASLEDQRRPLGAVLNGLLNSSPSTVVSLGPMPALTDSVLDLKDLAERMQTRNPLLEAWDHRAQSSLNAEKLASKQGLPNFSLGVNYILTGEARMAGVSDSGQDALMASLAVTVPLWRGKYEAAERVAVSKYQGALSSRRELLNNLTTALERTHFAYRDALRKKDLYGGTLLPKSRQSLVANRAAYQAGNGSFLDVMDSQRLVLEFELTRVRAEFDALAQEAMLEKLTASPIARPRHSNTKLSGSLNQTKDK